MQTKKKTAKTKTGSKRRLSLQICRVMAIIQVLHYAEQSGGSNEGVTSWRIHEVVNDCLPKPVCRRTIRRDLDALVEMGFAELVKVPRPLGTRPPYQREFWSLYRIAAPDVLHRRFQELGLRRVKP